MLKFGDKVISNLYFSDKRISKAYMGSKLIYKEREPIFLDYIESTGTQWIDTGIEATSITRFVIKGTCETKGSQNTQLLGTNSPNASTFFGARYYSNTGVKSWYCRDTEGVSLGNPTNLSIIDCTIESRASQYGTLTDLVDGSVNEFVSFTDDWGFTSGNLLLFGGESTRVSPNATCYLLQLYTADGLVRDLRPCLHPRTFEVCMYDMVTKRYFYNKGSNTFIAGNKINFVDYIESNNGAYINTGILPSYDYTVKIKYQYTSLSATFNPIFGMRTEAVTTGDGLFWAGTHYTTKEVYLRFGGDSVNYAMGDKALDIIEMTCSPEGVYINGEDTEARYFDGEITSEAQPICLFTLNTKQGANSGLGWTNAKVYSYQVFDGNMNLIQDLRPCVIAGEPCFYDMVTGRVFANAGTSTLKASGRFVESVVFDGDSWIDIEYIPSSNTRVVGKVSFTKWHPTAGANYVFGVYGDNANFGFNVGSNRGVMNVPWGTSAGVTFNNNTAFGQIYSFDISKNGAYLDGVLKLNASQLSEEFTATKSFYVGWSNGTSTQKLVGDVYPMQIYENDVLAQDLRPYVDEDGVPCLYDLITNVKFYNIGTGTLSYTE